MQLRKRKNKVETRQLHMIFVKLEKKQRRMNKIGKYDWEFRENTKVQEQKFYVLFLKNI